MAYELGKIRTDRGEFKDKGNQVFDVTHPDFGNQGAKGDGVTDDSLAFRDAIAAAVAVGGSVFAPTGSYRCAISSGTLLGIAGSCTIKGAGRTATRIVFDGTPTAAAKGFEQTANSSKVVFQDLTIAGPSDVGGFEVDGIYLNASSASLTLERVSIASGWNIAVWAIAGSNKITLRDVEVDGMPANPNSVGGSHVFIASATGTENTLTVEGGKYTAYGVASSNLFHAFYINVGTSFYIGKGVRFSDSVSSHQGAAIQVFGGTGVPKFQIIEPIMHGPGRGVLLHHTTTPSVVTQVRGGVIDTALSGLTARGCTAWATNVDFNDASGGANAITVGTTVVATVRAIGCRFKNHSAVIDNGNIAGSVFQAIGCFFAGAATSNITKSASTTTYLDQECSFSGGLPRALNTITDADTTPTVLGRYLMKTGNTGATTITALDDGYPGQTVVIRIADANTTIDFTGTTLKGNAGVDWSPANGDQMICVYDGGNWYCHISDNTA